MSAHKSLYEITGNIGDYNMVLINRAELQQLQKFASDNDELVQLLSLCVQFVNIARTHLDLDHIKVDDKMIVTYQWVENIRNAINRLAKPHIEEDVGVDQFTR